MLHAHEAGFFFRMTGAFSHYGVFPFIDDRGLKENLWFWNREKSVVRLQIWHYLIFLLVRAAP
jgi:hypothetical protein